VRTSSKKPGEFLFGGRRKSVIDLNAEAAHRALNLLVSQQKLHGPQIASAAADKGRFGSAQ
jgi:hypothetical protein